MKLKLKNKVYLLIGLPLTLQLVITAVLFANSAKLEAKIAEETFAKRVVSLSDRLHQLATDSFTTLATVRYSDKDSWVPVQKLLKRGTKLTDELRSMEEGLDPESKEIIEDYAVASEHVQVLLGDQFGGQSDSSGGMRYARFFREPEYSFELFVALKTVSRTSARLHKKFAQGTEDSTDSGAIQQQQLRDGLICALLADISLAVILASFYGKSVVDRLNTLMRNVDGFSKGQTEIQTVTGNDEISDLNEHFKAMVVERQRAEEERAAILQAVSHDIRGPVGSLNLTIGGLLKTYKTLDDSDIETRLKRLANESKRVVELCNTFLDLESFDEKGVDLKLEKVNVESLLENAREVFEESESAADHEVIIDCQPNITIDCDKARVIQILVNLLSNAAKFSNDGDEITMHAESTKDATTISVKDKGSGIAADKLSSLFERFSRLRNAEGKAGSGLGLWICKRLVELHGGSISCTSVEGQGSTFSVVFPNQLPAKADSSKAEPV